MIGGMSYEPQFTITPSLLARVEQIAALRDQAAREAADLYRTLAAQRIELTPGRRIGVGRARRDDRLLPEHLSERIAEHQRIASENGELILADPTVALRALTHQRPSFTHRELVSFLRARTHGAVQLAAVLAAVTQSGDLTPLAAVAGEERFTSRDTVEAEESLLRRCRAMACGPLSRALRRAARLRCARRRAATSRIWWATAMQRRSP